MEEIVTPIVSQSSLQVGLSPEQFLHLNTLKFNARYRAQDEDLSEAARIHLEARFGLRTRRVKRTYAKSALEGARQAIVDQSVLILEAFQCKILEPSRDFESLLRQITIQMFTLQPVVVATLSPDLAIKGFSDERIAKKLFNITARDELQVHHLEYVLAHLKIAVSNIDPTIVKSQDHLKFLYAIGGLFHEAVKAFSGKNILFSFA